MKHINYRLIVAGAAAALALSLSIPQLASAHCDTLDGPVIQDARKAIEAKNVTPVLKWVKAKYDNAVKAAFAKALAAKGSKTEVAHREFFASLVKIHRTGEGAPYAGLKPAGAVEPAVAEADRALAGGSSDALVKLLTDDVAAAIKKRFERAEAAYRHKDESVAQGREFVEAYVDLAHFVERLHLQTAGNASHDEHAQEHHAEHGGHRH